MLLIIRLRDRSEWWRERHPTRRHAPLLTLLYNSPRWRHTTRNAHGGSGGGDDGSGTFALSQPATTVRKVIRGFSRRRAPGFYTAAATCILPARHPFRHLHPPAICGAPPPPLTSWRKIGAISTRAHCGNARVRGGTPIPSIRPYSIHAVSYRRHQVLYPSAVTIILLLYYVCRCVSSNAIAGAIWPLANSVYDALRTARTTPLPCDRQYHPNITVVHFAGITYRVWCTWRWPIFLIGTIVKRWY